MEFERMNDAYRGRRFPKGSVFERSAGKNRKNSVILIILLAGLTAALGAGVFYFLSLTQGHREAGRSDQVTIGLVFTGVFAVLLLLCIVGIVLLVRGLGKGADAVIRASARACGLSEEQLREFDRQAMQSDCRILKLKNAVSAALAGQDDGLLTRDYLWLGDLRNCVLRREDLAGACLYEWSYYAGKKKIRCLSVSVVNRERLAVTAEASAERGRAFLALLKEYQPSIRIAEGVVHEGKEYDRWQETVCGQTAS